MPLSTRLSTIVVLVGLLAVGGWVALDASPADADGDAVRDPLSRQDRALVELGRRLFFDPVVSRTGTRSCASCHDPEHGFSDPEVTSQDDVGQTVRHSQTLIDSHLNPTAHWDGEFSSIEALVTARIGLPQSSSGGGYGSGRSGPLTPGHSSVPTEDPEILALLATGALQRELAKLPRAADVLETAGRYEALARAAFGNATLSRPRVAQAIAAYCRTIESTDAPYDRHLQGIPDALSESALRGLALFQGKAGCAQCHLATVSDGRKALKGQVSRTRIQAMERAPFTDFAFHNTGMAWLARAENLESLRTQSPISEKDTDKTIRREGLRPGRVEDPGRLRISTAARDRRAFKTPTLRDLARRGPYMHDGRFESLEQVIGHYARGGSDDPDQDPRLQPFAINPRETADLIAFLHALQGDARPGLAPVPCRHRVRETTLTLVDAKGHALKDTEVRLLPVGDVLPQAADAAAGPRTLRTDAKGRLHFAPGPTTHVRLSLGSGVVPVGGALVPDTCRKATIQVPVQGRVRLLLTLPRTKVAPPSLRAEHEGTFVFPGHETPFTRLTRAAVLEGTDSRIVTYEGWRRTDVPGTVEIRLPGGTTEHFDLRDGDTLKARLR